MKIRSGLTSLQRQGELELHVPISEFFVGLHTFVDRCWFVSVCIGSQQAIST